MTGPGSDTWADAIRFPPWIEDGEGTLFNRAFQLAHNAGAQSTDALRFAPPVDPFFHANPDTAEAQADHEV
jgi:hypothetical protein